MALFTEEEYRRRLDLTKAAMAKRGVDSVLITDPCNMFWLSGYNAWSFYTTQAMLVAQDRREPVYIGRALDRVAVEQTTSLSPDSIHCYSDDWVQMAGRNPADFIAETIKRLGLARGRMGVEAENYYLSPKILDGLRHALPNVTIEDIGYLVSRGRSVKSAAELAFMWQAAKIASNAMRVALDGMVVGARQCEVAGAIMQAQMAGVDGIGGTYTSSPPFLLTGRRGAASHLTWDDDIFRKDDTAYIELLGCRYRYQVTVSRAVHFGTPPKHVVDAAKASQEAIEAAIAAARPGVTCEEVANAMLPCFKRWGVAKTGRCGYATGIAYPPTSGERTMSLHPGDTTPLVAGMTFHVHPNLSFDDWGLYITESIVITESGCNPFTTIPRDLIVKH